MARGLFVHQGTRLEDLFGELARVLAAAPLPPLQNEVIAVPSQGMARWLRLQLAERAGIAAGLELPFLGAWFASLLQRDGATDPLERDLLVFRLWRLLRDPAHAERFGPATDYCRDDPDDSKRLQLCQRLARVFDDYQVYRPDVLARWTAGDDTRDLGPHAPWQARLWRQLLADVGCAPAQPTRRGARDRRSEGPTLFGDTNTPSPDHAPAPIRVDALRALLAQPGAAGALPPRVCVFGAGTLPPAFLQLLAQCAEHVPVHVFVPTPAPLREGDDSNAWLDAFGQQARELANLLTDLDDGARAPVDVGEVPSTAASPPRSLLACLQHEIARLDGGAPHPAAVRADDSFRVHDCHSVQREMEVVRDQILAAFDADHTLEPHDVCVLVPDIDAYAPIASAVFGPVAKHLPFRVADRTPASELPICTAVFALLQLAQSRFEVHDVFRILEEPAVHRRFHLFAGDLPMLRERCERAGIRWGIDAESRARTCRLPPFDDGSWRLGLERLLFGVATGPVDDLVLGVLPAADATSSRDDLLARFVTFVHTLFDRLPALARPQTPDVWADRLDDLLATMFAPQSADDTLALDRLRAVIARLRRAHADVRLHDSLTPVVLRDWLEQTLRESGGARGFLAGAVTVAALQPMRTVPARHLFVCGLDAASFPRSPAVLPFDLIARQRRLGDRDVRLDDRQLFLDVLLAARDSLHLTFVGHSQKDDSACAPSVLLAELLDLVERTFGTGVREGVVVAHPLQPWSERYRDAGGDPRLFTYTHAALPVTCDKHDEPPWFRGELTPPPELDGDDVPLDLLLAYWKSPCEFFLKNVCRMQVRGDDDAEAKTEPFVLDGLDKWRVQDDIVRRADLPAAATGALRLAFARATGRLPAFGHGELLFADLDDEAQRFLAARAALGERRTVDVRVTLAGATVHGQVDGVAAGALVVARMANLKEKDRLRGLVLHAVLAAARHAGVTGLPLRTVVLGKEDRVVYRPVDASDAAEALALLVRGYRDGLRAPLPFFPATSAAYGEATGDTNAAFAAARKEWEGNPLWPDSGDGNNRANQLCMRGREPFALPEFAAWASRIWRLAGDWTDSA